MKDYASIQTVLPLVGDESAKGRAVQLKNRIDDLNAHSEGGWELESTITVPAIDTLTIVDTLSRDK
ncbi:hypothetical protein J7E29_16710 [Streptomyces sp. ISL-90]|nr:hypothetical protein [Streptomyces sp. ISL-90]